MYTYLASPLSLPIMSAHIYMSKASSELYFPLNNFLYKNIYDHFPGTGQAEGQGCIDWTWTWTSLMMSTVQG